MKPWLHKVHGFFLMGFADKYILKNRGNYFIEPTEIFPLKMIVVIPCYNEQEISHTILSLFECEFPGAETGILVVINSIEKSPENILIQNRKTVDELEALSFQSPYSMHLFVIKVENLPEKKGGVGWARKIGMDWAVVHFNHFGNNEGIIVSLDADTLVEKNYLKTIYDYFMNNPVKVAATICFEHTFHPYDLRTDSLEEAMVFYELNMRYYRNALSFTGFNNSIYTVGSCFSVKVGAYVAQGGMNRRKAGEDFYFLHKMAVLGKIGEINTTTVYPSARLSDRVPFGTGPALLKYYNGNRVIEYSFPLEAFEILKFFFSKIERYYYLGNKLQAEDLSNDASFIHFSKEAKLSGEIQELIANCSSVDVFKKRFFHIFNAFRIFKWLNYAEVHYFPKTNLLIESRKLLVYMGVEENKIPSDPKLILNLFRALDRNDTIH